MHPTDNLVRVMPDIASEAAPVASGVLDWVGRDRIDLPVRLLGEDGLAVQYAARVAAYVNLQQPDARGIHMSRLYLHLDKALSAHLESLHAHDAVAVATKGVSGGYRGDAMAPAAGR